MYITACKKELTGYVCLYLDSHKRRGASVCTYVHRLTVCTYVAQYNYTQSICQILLQLTLTIVAVLSAVVLCSWAMLVFNASISASLATNSWKGGTNQIVQKSQYACTYVQYVRTHIRTAYVYVCTYACTYVLMYLCTYDIVCISYVTLYI